MQKRHQHRAIPARQETLPFSGPVAWPENPRAHGNICVVDVCRCGARRATNRNYGAVERGRWVEPESLRPR